MSEWESVFGEIDDDYLIGISNKGIVKRAYKDREEVPCEMLPEDAENGLAVKVGGETVHIKIPLGESQCTCPSRSICRHVILGILTAKETTKAQATTNIEVTPKTTETPKKAQTSETTEKPKTAQASETPETPKTAQASETTETPKTAQAPETPKTAQASETPETPKTAQASEVQAERSPQCADDVTDAGKPEVENLPSNNSMVKKVMEQIASYPVDKIWKIMGVKRMQEFIIRAKSGQKPKLEYSSVVTVQPLAQGMVVKLLFPLEYSTCTCHKKEFCAHKAEAVLWCKLESGEFGIDDLEHDHVKTADYDMEQVHDAALQMKAFLNELFDTGLSRTPQNALDYMERMAIISHNAKLPDFEGSWRTLQNVYDKYQKRTSSVRIQDVMNRITKLYWQTQKLEHVKNCLEISKLGGEFRAGYAQSLDLDLVGIAMEHFKSRSGYEGDTVYFLEENTKEWYTYTQTAPVFYENAAQRKAYRQETPWGLAVSVKDLASWHIRLRQAKCDNRGRLSSSRETKGELVAERKKDKKILTTEMLGEWYYEDFTQLFVERIKAKTEQVMAKPLLAFLKPESCEQAFFSETEQKLFMTLYDKDGKEVIVEVAYSKDEADGIKYLEKITNKNLPCFFGKIYLRSGRIRMYPIAVFRNDELEKSEVCEDG